jgi:hypothetical protein
VKRRSRPTASERLKTRQTTGELCCIRPFFNPTEPSLALS